MLKLRFKGKAIDDKVKVPEFGPRHVYGPEHFNDLSLRIELRRAYNRDPSSLPRKFIDLKNLPENVRIISSGFMTELEITLQNS